MAVVKYPNAHRGLSIIPYLNPDETFCDGRPPALLELCENIMARSTIYSQEMWR